MSEETIAPAVLMPSLPDDTQANAEPAPAAPVEAATPDAPVMGTGGDAAPEEAPVAPVEAPVASPEPAPEAAPAPEPAQEAPAVEAPAEPVAAPVEVPAVVASVVSAAEALAHPEVQKVVASLTEEAEGLRGRVQAAEDKAANLAEQVAQFAGHHPLSHFMQALESAVQKELANLGL